MLSDSRGSRMVGGVAQGCALVTVAGLGWGWKHVSLSATEPLSGLTVVTVAGWGWGWKQVSFSATGTLCGLTVMTVADARTSKPLNHNTAYSLSTEDYQIA